MRIKKGFLPFILGLCLSLALPLQAGAAVGVSSSELQEAMAVFLPSGESFSALDGYSHFDLVEKNAISGGVLGRYEARLQSNPWHDGKLPELQVLIYAYGSQDSAHSAFGELNLLSDWRKEILASDDRTRFFTTRDGGTDVDAFGTVNAEAGSYHLVHVNGNLLYQVSLFREDGNYLNEENLENYTEALDDALAAELLWEVLDPVVLSMSVLFPPASVDLSAKSEKSSLDLTELYEVPLNGQLSF